MRIKSNWFKPGREHTPVELAGALSFVIYRIADDALKNTRKAKFAVAVGAQYFSFLTEFLLFLIQVADRIAYRCMSEEGRFAFTSALANRIAETHAENESRLLGGELAECKRRFIDRLNQRAGEYAEFGYNENGPDFSFTRYLAFCMDEVVDEKDNGWIIDQMMSIAAPEAVDMVEKTFRNLLESEPRQARRRASANGD
jgi:hypothetical protein